MKRVTSWLAVTMGVAVLGFALAPNVNGQGTVEQSTFTLTEPLDVGGTILQPGDYQIKVVLLQAHRNLLQLTSADGTKQLATVLSIPHPEGPGAAQVPASRYVYYPASAGEVKVLRTWYAPNTPGLGGHDIVYPTQRAMELAARVKEPVVGIADEVQVADYGTAPLVVVTPEKEVKPYEEMKLAQQTTVPVVAVQKPPAPEAAPVQQTMVAENRPLPKQLPRTASNVPLYAGLGLLSLIGALGLGVLARRVA